MLALVSQLVSLGIFLGLTGWILVRWIRNSEDEPGKLILKWVLSLIVCGGALAFAAKAGDGFGQIAAILVGAVGGLVMAILWAPNFCAWVARPFAALYDGGDVEADPTPIYGPADAKLKRGDAAGAIEDIRRQLETFPTDLEGNLKLAQIQAENLKDIDAASRTIWSFISATESPAPSTISIVLNRLADWQINIAMDPASARGTLEKIIQLVPETEQASLALQRIARLPSTQHLADSQEAQIIAVPAGPQRIGLQPRKGIVSAPGEAPDAAIDRLVARLNEYPQDSEAREQLAILYEEHLGRPELALEQWQQLIDQPHQPAKHTARWLNLMADVYVRRNDIASARSCLEEIISRNPDAAIADQTRQRLSLLGMEIRGQKKSQAVKLGSYEKNLGLKPRA